MSSTVNIPAAAMDKKVDTAIRYALRETATAWHKAIMPRHFDEAASSRYGYQKRSGEGEPEWIERRYRIGGAERTKRVRNQKYFWKKLRRKGHRRPLVWTGRSLAAAKADAGVKISKPTAQTLRGTVTLPQLPKYFYQFLKPGTYQRSGSSFTLDHETPHKHEELIRVTPSEERTLNEHFETAMNERLQSLLASGKRRQVQV